MTLFQELSRICSNITSMCGCDVCKRIQIYCAKHRLPPIYIHIEHLLHSHFFPFCLHYKFSYVNREKAHCYGNENLKKKLNKYVLSTFTYAFIACLVIPNWINLSDIWEVSFWYTRLHEFASFVRCFSFILFSSRGNNLYCNKHECVFRSHALHIFCSNWKQQSSGYRRFYFSLLFMI